MSLITKLSCQAMEGIISTVESEAVSAFRCVEDFTTDALKSVDLFANEVTYNIKCCTTFKSDLSYCFL